MEEGATGAVAKRDRESLALPLAAVAALVAGGVVFVLTVYARLGQDVPLLLAGPLVGGAVRLFTGGVSPRLAVFVSAIAFVGALAGFVAADIQIWEPFMIEGTIRRALSLVGIVLFAFTTYLAYIIAARSA